MPPINPARYISPVEAVPDAEYKTVAVSTTLALGTNGGAVGDALFGMLLVPIASGVVGAPGVTLTDGSGSAITIVTAGTFVNIAPIWVPLNILSTSGAWKVITGAGISVIAVGKFS